MSSVYAGYLAARSWKVGYAIRSGVSKNTHHKSSFV